MIDAHAMKARPGLYILSDSAHPGKTVPMLSTGGQLFAFHTRRLDTEGMGTLEFETLQFAGGPFTAESCARHAQYDRDLEVWGRSWRSLALHAKDYVRFARDYYLGKDDQVNAEATQVILDAFRDAESVEAMGAAAKEIETTPV